MKTPQTLFRFLLLGLILVFYPIPSLHAAQDVEPKPFTVQVTGSGRPMILIPGLACGGNVWDATVAHFKDTYQCHVITLAGFAGQPSIGSPFLERVGDSLIAYIHDQKLDHPIIVGHSLGAFLAFSLGSNVPDEVGPIIAVDGVPYFPALNDVTATPKTCLPFAQGAWMSMVMQSPEQFAKTNKGFLSGMITDPKELDRVAEVSNRSDPKAVGQAFFEIMITDLRPKVDAIRAPVLLLGATATISKPEEKNTAEENYRLQVAPIPRHQVVFAPKARHFIQLDEPEFFFREVESFLKAAGAVEK